MKKYTQPLTEYLADPAVGFTDKLADPRLYHRLRAYCLKLTKKPDDADDLLQDVFLLAMEKQHQYEARNLEGWLATICFNRFVTGFRRKRKQGERVGFEEAVLGTTAHACYNLAPAQLDLDAALAEVDKLRPQYKQATLLRANGYKYDEIADEMGIGIDRVKTLLFVVRHALNGTTPGPHAWNPANAFQPEFRLAKKNR